MKLFLSPHNDDEVLFGAFTILRESPEVCVVYDSYIQPARGIPGCEAFTRCGETDAALRELGCSKPPHFAGAHDDSAYTAKELANFIRYEFGFADEPKEIERLWAPAYEGGGHDHHNLVAHAAEILFPGKVTRYLTYTRAFGKSRSSYEVQPRTGDDIARKLRALACYTSQLQMDPRLGCWPHFMNDLREYIVP